MMAYKVKQLEEFFDWLKGLKDGLTRQRLIKRLRKVQLGNSGDVEPVGEGVFEMLGGGDKSTQQADIWRAIALAKFLED
jgi:putative component of toxin-antitoxin plasmid stabilization module